MRGRATSVHLFGCPFDLSFNIVGQWIKLFGQITEGPFLSGDAVQVYVVLERDMPAILPIEGARISVVYRGIDQICYNCYAPGHLQRSCYKTGNWFEYLYGLQARYNIPTNYFKELREREHPNYQRSFYIWGFFAQRLADTNGVQTINLFQPYNQVFSLKTTLIYSMCCLFGKCYFPLFLLSVT